MKVKDFCQYLSKLEKTTSRNEITAILADLFKQVSVKEIDKVCYLTLGQLAPLHRSILFNMAEKMMIRALSYSFKKPEEEISRLFKKTGDLGNVAQNFSPDRKKISLTVLDFYNQLLIIAQQEGSGSQERKIKLFSQLAGQLDPLSNRYLARITLGKLRLGFSDLTILDALSWMKTKTKELRPDLERAYNVSTDIGLVAQKFKKGGIKAIEKIQPQVGIPIRPALPERLSLPEKIVEKLGRFGLEPKYDGFRVQIHLDQSRVFEEKTDSFLFNSRGGYVRIFSRRLENTTPMFPDIVETIQKLKIKSAIFDGEAIGHDPKTGRFLPFQETAQRKRKYDVKEAKEKVPLKVFLFDLLYFNGKPLLKKTFKQRRFILEKIFQKNRLSNVVNLTPQKIVKTEKELEKYFDQYINQGLEGILCKKMKSHYRAGARDFTWVKYKKAMDSRLADTIDCLVMGYYRGRGKRSKFGIGAFLTGIWDSKNKNFSTIAKIGTGLTDNQWREIRQKADQNRALEKPKQYQVPKELAPDVWVEPEIVVEIEADEITKSPIHSSGCALRFPRMKKFREKKATEITSLKEVVKLYKIQS